VASLDEKALEKRLEQLEKENQTLRKQLDAQKSDSAGLFGRLNRLIRNRSKGKNTSSNNKHAEILRNSVWFDAEWYAETYEDELSQSELSHDPALHYLMYGGFKGFNPSLQFDSNWYFEEYPDVAQAGMNPLIHFILNGEREGRLPKPFDVANPLGNTFVTLEYYREKLWSGYSEQALREIERLATEGRRAVQVRAHWYLARWYYAHGDIETAQNNIQVMIGKNGRATKQMGVGLAKCLTLKGEFDALEEILEDEDWFSPTKRETLFLKANALSEQPERVHERLRYINDVFLMDGLTGITCQNEEAPLTLENIGYLWQGKPQVDTQASKISVVIPAYNAESTIHIALDSILNQTWRNIEVIVVDDFSTDETAAVVTLYEARDSRVRLLRNEVNLGAYPSRNRGMKAATGEYVTVHDSDDWSHPQKLEKMVQVLELAPEKMASVSFWVRVTRELNFVGSWFLNESFLEKNHSSALIRRSVLDEIGYWDTVNVAGDSEFLWRLEKHYGFDSILFVLKNTPLSFALSDDTSLTRTKMTHVKTIHFGLRRMYREAARWWHENSQNHVLIEGSREFPVPLGNTRSRAEQFDLLVVDNFTDENKNLAEVLLRIREKHEQGLSVLLFHWPYFNGWTGAPVSSNTFKLMQELAIQFTHGGDTVAVSKIWVVDTRLLEHVVDSLPLTKDVNEYLTGLEAARVSDSLLVQQCEAVFREIVERETD